MDAVHITKFKCLIFKCLKKTYKHKQKKGTKIIFWWGIGEGGQIRQKTFNLSTVKEHSPGKTEQAKPGKLQKEKKSDPSKNW